MTKIQSDPKSDIRFDFRSVVNLTFCLVNFDFFCKDFDVRILVENM